MANWLLREGSPSTEVSAQSSVVVIRIRRGLSIKPRDRLLLLSSLLERPAFTHRATVGSVEEVKAEEDGLRVYRLTVDKWQPLDRAIERDEFRYSLTVVRNLEKPFLHFRQGYRRLPESDYISIREGE